MKTITLKIGGIHCKSCEQIIKMELEDIGVDKVSIGFDEKKVSLAKIRKAITK